MATHPLTDLFRLIWGLDRLVAVAIILGVLVYVAVAALVVVEVS